MFAKTLILAFLPAALAGASVICDVAYTGQANLNCYLTRDGFNGAAASYIATAMYADSAAAYDAWRNEFANDEYLTLQGSYYNQPGLSTKTNIVTELVTFEVGHASFITQPTLRAAVTSILEVGFSINNAAVAQQTSAGTAGTAKPSATIIVSNGITITAPLAATGTTAAGGSPAGSSTAASTSTSKAGAWSPMQTGANVHVVAGVAAGLVGLAIGL